MQQPHGPILDSQRLKRWLSRGPRPAVSRPRITVEEEKRADEQLIAFLCSPLSYTIFPSIPAGQRRWVHIRAEWLDIETHSAGESGAPGGGGTTLRTLTVRKPEGWSLQEQLAKPPITGQEAMHMRQQWGDALQNERKAEQQQVAVTRSCCG